MAGKKIADLDLPLERDLFLRKLLRELTGTLEQTIGIEAAAGYIATVGSVMGEWIDKQYKQGLGIDQLTVEQVAEVFIDLKKRIHGDFFLISMDSDTITVGNKRCPFGEFAEGRDSLCMMTSNVFGRIAANNLGYARVELEDTIAKGSATCRIVIHLKPDATAEADEREFYRLSA